MEQSKIDAIEEGLALVLANLENAKQTRQWPMFVELAMMQIQALQELFDHSEKQGEGK